MKLPLMKRSGLQESGVAAHGSPGWSRRAPSAARLPDREKRQGCKVLTIDERLWANRKLGRQSDVLWERAGSPRRGVARGGHESRSSRAMSCVALLDLAFEKKIWAAGSNQGTLRTRGTLVIRYRFC